MKTDKDTEKEKMFEFSSLENKSKTELIKEEGNFSKKLTGFELKKNQIKAHLLKNLSFQKKQTSQNVFHIFGPIICIFLMWLTFGEIKKEFLNDYNFDKINGIPFYLNLPFSFFSKSAAYPVSVNNCLKWFLYEDKRENNVNEINLKLDDILKTQFHELCPTVQKIVPYFIQTEKNVNSEIFKTMDHLKQFKVKINEEIEDIDLLPDAGLTIKNLSVNKINICIQINDLLFTEFHRDNGFSKMSFKIIKPDFNYFEDNGKNLEKVLNEKIINKKLIEKTSNEIYNSTVSSIEKIKNSFMNKNATFPTVTSTEGILNTIDLITKNYLNLKNKKTKIVSSISYMDTISTTDLILNSIIVLIIVAILPLGVSSHFSLFLHLLISEKEEKTKWMMLVHGTKMEFYYFLNYFYFFCISFCSSMFFILGSFIVLDLQIFKNTSIFLIFFIFGLWAHSQIALSFFAQLFPINLKITTSIIKSFCLYPYYFLIDDFCVH